MALVLVLVNPSTARSQTGPADRRVIVAQGDSILMLPPDRAFVHISAEGRASKPADAQRLAAKAMASVQAALKAAGIDTVMFRTAAYSLQPQYDYNAGRTTFREYLARNVIEVRVDDLSRLPNVLDAAGSSSPVSVSSLRFDLKNRGPAELDALQRAVRDANARANAIAQGAGKTLGPIVRLQEHRTSSGSPVFQSEARLMGVGGPGSPTPVEPGEIQVRAQVTITVALR